ncbi:DotI/IcmL family type IV secretion protein [Acidiphilium sp.]|uniref:DotI/IcmL family type IV secretion protein n=1 Tax=Acidiphilium sp. TaxID=527 RepID=UPI003CFF9E49
MSASNGLTISALSKATDLDATAQARIKASEDPDPIVALYQRLVHWTWVSIIQGCTAFPLLAIAAPALVARPVPPIEVIGRAGTFTVTPLRNLAMSETFIADWAACTITAAYAVNPVDFQTILTKVRRRFTAAAWRSFAASYKAGGDASDLHKLLKEQLTGFAQTTADPVVVHRGFGHNATFTVAFPLIVTWQNANGLVSRRYDVRVVVRRASVRRHHSGLAIEKFTAESKGV